MASWTPASRYGKLRALLYLGKEYDTPVVNNFLYNACKVYGYRNKLYIVVRMIVFTKSEPAVTLEEAHVVRALFNKSKSLARAKLGIINCIKKLKISS